MGLLKESAKILGGSTLAGFGFSFGRDIYKNAKQRKGVIIGLIFLAGAFVGLYSSGVIIARNYANLMESVLKRVGGILLFIPCAAVVAVVGLFVSYMFEDSVPNAGESLAVIQTQSNGADANLMHFGAPPESEFTNITAKDALIMTGTTSFPFLIGLGVGVFQRKQRQKTFHAIKHNAAFLDNLNLIEVENDRVQDKTLGQVYKVDIVTDTRVTLRLEGSRGKRAYILVDPDGLYYDFSGIIPSNQAYP